MTEQLNHIETLINQGRFLEARLACEIELKGEHQLRTLQLLALAMSKSGLSEPAIDILAPAYQKDNTDPETAGILGSIYKRLFKKTQDNKFAALARSTYQQNFSVTHNYYTGINTASMAIVSGKGSEGRMIAKDIITMLNPASEDFWEQASLGEAYLLSKDKPNASLHYLHARKLAGKEWGKLQSVYDQLLLLNFFIAVPTELLKAFSPPTIIAFTGHMIDQPDRPTQRFPASIERSIKEAIVSAIRTTGASIGYTSMSCGSDILFAEAMEEEGGELHLFLPFNREDYLRESVRFAGEHWVQRFEALEKKHPIVYVTQERYTGNDDLFSFQNKVILGSVALRAAMNFTTPTLLTVLSDTDIQQKEGGTRDTLVMWPYKDHHINVNPDKFLDNRPQAAGNSRKASSSGDIRNIYYVLIADLPGGNANDKESFKNFVIDLKEHLLLKPHLDKMDAEYIAAFKQPMSVLEMAKTLLSFKKSFGEAIPVRMSMHVLVLSGDSFQEADIDGAIRFHQITPPGIPSAYGWFAAATNFSMDSWVIEFAGMVGDSQQQPNEVYSIQIKKN